jgi:putative methyltransferase (TIGR01177 family)
MIVGYVQTSGESALLARAEAAGAVEALGGRLGRLRGPAIGLVEVEVDSEERLRALASRLALARRTLVAVSGGESPLDAARLAGAARQSAEFRRLGGAGRASDPTVRRLGQAFVDGGGSIDLEDPSERFWLLRPDAGPELLLREVAAVDRRGTAARAMPRLPFRRPVALPPRLARAAANLASIRPGDRVLDPFLGTGALLGEAAILGARVYGLDADAEMVRGALRNLAHLGVAAEALAQGDARSAELPGGPPEFDAILTDPPYGRSSASVGDRPERLVPEALSRWAGRVAAGGRVVVVAPGGPPTLSPPWAEACRVPVRVHRSLTREFRLYRRLA